MKTTLLAFAVFSAFSLAFGQGVKITDLDAISSVAGEDLTHVYDMSQASGSRSKKATMNQIRSFLSNDVNFIGGSITNLDLLTFAPSEDDTIEAGQTGFGWIDERFTIQTPVGALQFYEAGSPAEAIFYWPGRIVTGKIETGALVAEVDGAQVTGGVIPKSVMQNSMPPPLYSFNDLAGAAGANGLTYATTGPGAQIEPTNPGMYYAAIQVTDGGTDNVNTLVGKIRSASQLRTDIGIPGGTTDQVQYNTGSGQGGVTGLTLNSGTLTTVSAVKTLLGTTTTPGVVLANSTAAANGAQQVSPALVLLGSGYKTNTTAGSQTLAAWLYVDPVQGAASPTGSARLAFSTNGGALDLTYTFHLIDGGSAAIDVGSQNSGGRIIGVPGGFFLGRRDSLNLSSVGAECYIGNYNQPGINMTATGFYSWGPDQNLHSNRDTILGRDSAGVVQMGVDINGSHPNEYVLKAADGITGSNRQGGTLVLAGGSSTGSGLSSVVIRTAAPGGTATTAHAVADRLHVSHDAVQVVPPLFVQGTGPITGSGSNIVIPGGIAFNGGSGGTVTKVLYNSNALDFPDTPNGTTSDLTISVPGAADQDVVMMGVASTAMVSNSSFFAWVSAPDTVTVRFINNSGSSQDLPEATFRACIIQN